MIGWNISQGINSISTHNYISYFGGQDHFNGTTILQNLYNLQHPHYSVQVDIEMIINEKIKYVIVQLDDKNNTYTSNQSAIELINFQFTFEHHSQMACIRISTQSSEVQSWWGISQFTISTFNCSQNVQYCQTNQNQNMRWKLLYDEFKVELSEIDHRYYKIFTLGCQCTYQNIYFLDLKFFSSEQDSKMLFDYQLQVKSSILVKIRFKLMTLTTASFKVLVDGNIKLEFNYYQVNSYFLYYCYGDYFIYQIEIDTNIYNQDQLQLQINFDFNRWVNIIDFRVYHIQAETWQQPKAIFGCLHALYDQCLMCQEGWIYYPIIKSCQMNLGDENRDLVVFQDDHQSEYSGNITQIQSIPILDQQTSLYLISELIGYKEGGNIINILSICGDGVVGMTEECDDSNQFQFDGCFNCQFSCPLNCQQCNYGKCVTCDLGYELNKYQCTPICGDQLIQQYEICDDGNQIKFDGCHKCQNNCQLECYNCISTYCVECYEGWNLIDGKCEQMCGDEQVAFMSYEQCDNHNDNNCVNCSLKCEYNCQVCLSSQQCVICSYSYQLIDGTCQSVCGDGIVNKEFEDCDDENNIMYDGCFECSLQCSLGCILCEEDNYCKKCDSQFYKLDLTTHLCEIVLKQDAVDNNQNNDNQDQENQNNNLHCNYNYIYVDGQCINQCGNARFQNQYEQCDDGNTIGGDGCSQSCTIENQFVCETIEYQQSECLFLKPPDFYLNMISDRKNQTQTVELTFTQQVRLKIEMDFEEWAQIAILPETDFLVNVIPITNLTSLLGFPQYQINIIFKKPVNDPIFQITIYKSSISSEDNQEPQNSVKMINLGQPFVLPESIKQQVMQVSQMNDAMMYSMMSISTLALATGNAILFFNMLDLLQSLSYIRFMQYQFPPHLQQFLDTYTKVSLKPILDYFQVDSLIAKLNGGSLPYQSSRSSTSTPSINTLNCYYIMNAKSCFFSLAASLMTYFLSILVSNAQVNNCVQKYFNKYFYNFKFLKLLTKFQRDVQLKCLKLKNQYFSTGIYQVYFAALHQLCFSTFLQFPEYSANSIFEIFNSTSAIISCIVIIFISFKSFAITSAIIKDTQKWKYFYVESKDSFWAINIKSFQIYRIQFYIFVIVFLINYPEAQSVSLSTFSLFYLFFLLKFRPLKSQYDLTKLIIKEILFSLIIGSFLVYSYNLDNNLNLLFGWIHIGMFSLMLASNLVIDIVESVQKVYKNYLKKKIRKQQQEIHLFTNNPLQKFIYLEYNKKFQK
ncbi:unnamed protein product (macronuclear) [Paramecium tetraurelia]|uniref:Uncharacterized protein n=1 Tax=Paramecium tetraurelia TaxID=5888 RepID=A0BFS7_PARTE|nr:uncharacterized protein GSPATT00028429001 [Paramecium tetraurelia]CAK57394.1 unnamed protein product [Paramecium tetraurelia]|eukprot:XP_001424792.1 hypothetical protein (macronuclear) [Paramecium tetraurelia strain d4-2]